VLLLDASQIRAVLLDIEGTTTPVDFVTKVLFPYAAREVESFLRRNLHDREIQSVIHTLKDQHQSDLQAGVGAPPWHEFNDLASITAYIHWLMSRDSKIGPLKSLQGKIWLEGYTKGELRGEVYPDVPPALRRWKQQGRGIYIYSSGSVLAQKLLFGSTAYGDLTPLLDGFFDTNVGTKTDSRSYHQIALQIGTTPDHILFLSDAVRELEAARSIGMHVALTVHPPQTEIAPTEFPVIRTFDKIFLD
jgi:enolase-phosphatase E1